jgi:wyosine [tRNA(Phe)-imidazoG37] synthetase (radical SAM superfamily)
MSYVFGPVPSRRLGRSLGVDLVPYKTCTYDCVYCQLGRTTRLSAEPVAGPPVEEIVAEVQSSLHLQPDFLTLGGSGEPTLHEELEELVRRLREVSPVPLAVLTNGSLFWREEIREALDPVDVVLPSLDVATPELFARVNRPCPEVTFDLMLEGLRTFARTYTGKIWLEILLLEGISDSEEHVAQLAQLVEEMQPELVQLNTVDRPPAEPQARAVSAERLEALAALFTPPAEVVADTTGVHAEAEFTATRELVLSALRRRPCSTADLARGLGAHPNEVLKHVGELIAEGLVETTPGTIPPVFRALADELS